MEKLEVHWVDIYSDADWQPKDCWRDFQPKHCESIGYKVKETEHNIWIAQTVDTDSPHEYWGNITVIPKGVIEAIYKL